MSVSYGSFANSFLNRRPCVRFAPGSLHNPHVATEEFAHISGGILFPIDAVAPLVLHASNGGDGKRAGFERVRLDAAGVLTASPSKSVLAC